MAWTDKANMLLGVNEPARSVDINAIYDNTAAMANGDAGAPEITEAALDTNVTTKLNAGANGSKLEAPLAGTTYLLRNGGSSSGSFTGVDIDEAYGYLNVDIVSKVIATGAITVEFTSTFTLNSGTTQMTVTVYTDGTIANSHTYSASVSNDLRTFNIGVTKGQNVWARVTIDGAGGSGNGSYSTSVVYKAGNDVLGLT